MEIPIKANNSTMKLMVSEFILIIMAQYTKGTDLITSRRAKGPNCGLMAASMNESSRVARSTAKESTFGQIEVTTLLRVLGTELTLRYWYYKWFQGKDNKGEWLRNERVHTWED